MNKLSFRQKIAITFTDAPSYKLLLKESFKSSLLFFLVMIFLVSPLYGLKIIYRTFPEIIDKLTIATQEFTSVYPEGVVVNWDKNQLVIQPSDTYSLEYPSFINSQELALPRLAATFIPEELNPDEFTDQLSDLPFMVITPRFVYLQNNSEHWSAYPLNQLLGFDQDFQITKNSLDDQSIAVINQLSTNLQNSKWIVFLLSPLVVLVMTILKSVLQVLFGFVVVVKLQNDKLSFLKFTQLSLYVMVVATVIDLTASLLYPNQPLHVFTVSYWMVMLYVMYILKLKQSLKTKP